MSRQIKSALISVFYKDGLEPLVKKLYQQGVEIYSTGGTQAFIESLEIPCKSVEGLTSFPSILGGRVKTLHPKVFGGILARRDNKEDESQLLGYEIPQIDLVIVDLYPFEETVASTNDEVAIIEKIDIGGVSLIRAAAKNHKDVAIISSRDQYEEFLTYITQHEGKTDYEYRRSLAVKAFATCAHYDVAIAQYFDKNFQPSNTTVNGKVLRYGENPHQKAVFQGDINEWFDQLNGKELSFNNLVDTDAACRLIAEFNDPAMAVIKHTNVCGLAQRPTLEQAWKDALAGDHESAFGGVLASNKPIDLATATSINELFFEILVAPGFDDDALALLKSKKNRILLLQKKPLLPTQESKMVFNANLVQDADTGNFDTWTEAGARPCTEQEAKDLKFANVVVKHLKSNAIAFVKNEQLIGKGCGQTSRIDALRQAVDKAKQFNFSLEGAVMASDAFFPFNDCITMAKEQGITAVIQPGGSIRDQDTIDFAKAHDMALVITGMRHFKH